MPSYIIICLGLTIGYALFYWYWIFNAGNKDIDVTIYDILIPILLPGIPVLVFLRPKFKQLIMKKEKQNMIYVMFAWILLMWPLLCVVYFVDIKSGGVTTLNTIDITTKTENTWFYKIPTFDTDKRMANYDYTVSEYGKKYNRSLALDIYFVAPIITKGQMYASDFKYKYWISANYHLSRRKNSSDEVILGEFQEFTKKSAEDFYSGNSLVNIDHFEKMQIDGPRDTSLAAAKKIAPNNIAESPVFLMPETRTMAERSNYYLLLTLGGLIGNIIAFVLLLLIPKFKSIPAKPDEFSETRQKV